MLEILKFVLNDFWIFCGTVVLIYVSGESVAMIISAAFGRNASFSLINMPGKKKEDKKGENNGVV